MKIAGIYPKVFVTVLCAVLIPLVIGGVYVFISERDAVRERVDRQLEQVASVVETRVDGWVEANDRVLIQNTTLADLKSMVAERQVPVLQAMVRALDWVYLSSVVASDARQVSRNDGGKLVDYSDRAYFHQALARKTLANQVVIAKTSGEPVLVLARGFPTDTGTNAVLLISSHLRDIAQAIKTARIGQTGYAFMLDENGKVISHPKAESSGTILDMSTNAAFQATRATPNWRGSWTEGDIEYLGYAHVTKMGWVIVVQQEAAEAYAPVRSAAIKATLITAVAALIGCLAAWALAGGFALPILRLREYADRLSEGDANVPSVETDRPDEIGELARSIEKLGNSVNVAFRRMAKLGGG